MSTKQQAPTDIKKMAAFVSELSKIAKKETSKQDESTRQRRVGLGMLGGGLTSAIGGGYAIGKALKSPVVGADDALFDRLKAKAHIPVYGPDQKYHGNNTKKVLDAFRSNAAWMPPDNMRRFPKGGIFIGAGVNKHPAILAHELGHAALDANPVGRVIQNKITNRFARLYGAVPLLPSMMASSGVGMATAHSDNEVVRGLGRWAPMLAAAPHLMAEGGASLSGLMQMRRAGASKRQLLKGVGQLVPAFSTYAAKPLLYTGAAHLGQSSGLEERARDES